MSFSGVTGRVYTKTGFLVPEGSTTMEMSYKQVVTKRVSSILKRMISANYSYF